MLSVDGADAVTVGKYVSDFSREVATLGTSKGSVVLAEMGESQVIKFENVRYSRPLLKGVLIHNVLVGVSEGSVLFHVELLPSLWLEGGVLQFLGSELSLVSKNVLVDLLIGYIAKYGVDGGVSPEEITNLLEPLSLSVGKKFNVLRAMKDIVKLIDRCYNVYLSTRDLGVYVADGFRKKGYSVVEGEVAVPSSVLDGGRRWPNSNDPRAWEFSKRWSYEDLYKVMGEDAIGKYFLILEQSYNQLSEGDGLSRCGGFLRSAAQAALCEVGESAGGALLKRNRSEAVMGARRAAATLDAEGADRSSISLKGLAGVGLALLSPRAREGLRTKAVEYAAQKEAGGGKLIKVLDVKKVKASKGEVVMDKEGDKGLEEKGARLNINYKRIGVLLGDLFRIVSDIASSAESVGGDGR